MWYYLTDASVKIFVSHVDAHTGKLDENSKNNDIVNKLAKIVTLRLVNRKPWAMTKRLDTKLTLHRSPQWEIQHIEIQELIITKPEVLEIHKILGHIGKHVLYT